MGDISQKKQILDEFFQNLKDFGDRLSQEDLDVATESLQLAFDDLLQMKNETEQKKKEADRKKREEEKARLEQERKQREQAHIEAVTSMDLPLSWSNPFNALECAQGIHIDSIPDALIKSLATLGVVDIEFIASVTGNDYKTVIKALKGSIYQNPLTWNECFYKGWETADEYLSGNMMRKYDAALEANKKYNGYFSENISAIEAVLPKAVAPKDIYITLGTPWVPTDIIEAFILYLFGEPYQNRYLRQCEKCYCLVSHDDITGTWEITNKWLYAREVKATSTYGTSRINALHLLEKTINLRQIAVYDTDKSTNKRTLNASETALALEKQKELTRCFQKWVWSDKDRKERLTTIFEDRFSCVKRRIFDGSFLEFPNMSPEVKLYPYQKDAVARILFTPNTLLAHDVGAGKTYIMIAAGMELKRMGLSKKNLYVVPNNVLTQWVSIYRTMYPQANLLVVNQNNFSPAKRENTLIKMRDNTYDAILMTYSCFEMIPLSRDYYEDELNDQIKEIEEIIHKRMKSTNTLSRHRFKLQKKLREIIGVIEDSYDGLYFDELGITRLFVDEAHNFKNVPLKTKMGNILGVNKSGSKRCQDMMDKVHMVQKQNDGKGVVFATGTPITNSVTDAYIMQQYLQSGELAGVDLQSFDSWVGMFAEKSQEFEVDVDTTNYRIATRLAKFHNLPELTALFSSVADFHSMDNVGLPDFDGYTTATIPKTQDFENFLMEISCRADAVRCGSVNRTDDNMLKITTDGRKGALDLRLIDNQRYGFTMQSKVVRCAENVFDVYQKTSAAKATQIVFCDISTPKGVFNIYDELKHLLITYGIPAEEIAFIHDAASANQRKKLFKRFNAGEVRVLIGSTFKLGLGVNVQQKLIAVHHLDVPWRPSDMTQREGRILRQGNTNERVQIFRYITKGSFDAYSWQLLETKQRFITDLLSGCVAQRSASDIDDTVLDYAEVKAIAIGNPLMKRRVETANKLNRLIVLQHKQVETKMRLEQELAALPAKLQNQQQAIENCRLDLEQSPEFFREYSKEERLALRAKLHEAVCQNALQIQERVFYNYQGFDIILPANMSEENPYIWLQRHGRYYVELGKTEVGNLIRIDHFLENLPEYYKKLRAGLAAMQARQSAIEEELPKREDYTGAIAQKEQELEELDEQLGVEK
ncbi:MAG: DEAD/DEAH box helicase family protein [Clostridia bacterium]|nr:DEAD/DEAH box helicase family protein [Clostridia bacterium]